MSSEGYHEPVEELSQATRDMHRAIISLMEELEAIDWYAQRAEACKDPELRSILEHNPSDAASVDDDGWLIAGMAIWFRNFFTWTAKHSIYLDDLYVREQYRGLGYGKALLQHLAQICIERGYPRLDWWVLDWNPAVEFYKRIGAVGMDEWTVNRVSGEALERLASIAPPIRRD